MKHFINIFIFIRSFLRIIHCALVAKLCKHYFSILEWLIVAFLIEIMLYTIIFNILAVENRILFNGAFGFSRFKTLAFVCSSVTNWLGKLCYLISYEFS